MAAQQLLLLYSSLMTAWVWPLGAHEPADVIPSLVITLVMLRISYYGTLVILSSLLLGRIKSGSFEFKAPSRSRPGYSEVCVLPYETATVIKSSRESLPCIPQITDSLACLDPILHFPVFRIPFQVALSIILLQWIFCYRTVKNKNNVYLDLSQLFVFYA